MPLYEKLPIDEETPVQYVGVYVMHWRPEWGTPEAAFRPVEDDDQAAVIDALKQAHSFFVLTDEACATKGQATPEDVIELMGVCRRALEKAELAP